MQDAVKIHFVAIPGAIHPVLVNLMHFTAPNIIKGLPHSLAFLNRKVKVVSEVFT